MLCVLSWLFEWGKFYRNLTTLCVATTLSVEGLQLPLWRVWTIVDTWGEYMQYYYVSASTPVCVNLVIVGGCVIKIHSVL